MIPVRSLFSAGGGGGNNNDDDRDQQNNDDHHHNNNIDNVYMLDSESDNEEELVYINDDNDQPEEEVQFGEADYMVDDVPFFDELNGIVPSIISGSSSSNSSAQSTSESSSSAATLVDNYFKFRLGSLALFQKKTTQLGFPLRLIYSLPLSNTISNTTNKEQQQEESTTTTTPTTTPTIENLPSYLLQEYLFTEKQLLDHPFQGNDVQKYVNSLLLLNDDEKKSEEKKEEQQSPPPPARSGPLLLSPLVHLTKDYTRMKFSWRSATSLEYKHAKIEKNVLKKMAENDSSSRNDSNHLSEVPVAVTENSTLAAAETVSHHQYLENLPSVFEIQKLPGPTPIAYYYNERIVIQLHPYLCLQVKPSELRQSKHFNISQSKTTKYRGYYFYFEITIVDSGFTSKYNNNNNNTTSSTNTNNNNNAAQKANDDNELAVTEVGVGLANYEYSDGMTGWYKQSIGYHTDCGRIYLNMPENTEKNCAGKAKIGDTIGVAWSLDSGSGGEITFTRNGCVCRTVVGESCWRKDFFSKEFSRFCPTISSDYEQRVFYVNMGLNRAIYPFRYFVFNTYEEQEVMFSFVENGGAGCGGGPFVDIDIVTTRGE